ncbi:MAG: GyrI-like domain-containing protein [Thaumarchaeota archaeon]|nr:GyrI-like domain-containing protein [Nitrososphaerota archaeon]
MVVDIRVKTAPSYTVASLSYRGEYPGQDILRPEFDQLVKWAREKKIRTGKWIFNEPSERHWEACLEVRGRPRSHGKIRVKTLPKQLVASVKFDPDQFAARLVYHGISDWLRWRKKDGKYESVGSTREVYSGSPWSSGRAWKNTEIQFPIKKLERPSK